MKPQRSVKALLRALLAAVFASGFTAAAVGATSLRVAYVPVIGATPLFVLQEQGWAKAAGLDLTFKRFDSGPAAIAAFGSGTIDALAIGVAPVAVARAKGLDARVISAVAQGGSGFVAGPRLAQAFTVGGRRCEPRFRNLRASGGPAGEACDAAARRRSDRGAQILAV